jgi:hypothetical protein
MIDFIAAYKKGLNAAEIADKNQREIDSVFDDLNKQLAAATDGKVKIIIKGNYMSGIRAFLAQADEDLKVINKKYTPSDEKILALNPLTKVEEGLAYWSQDRYGYPCKISYDNKVNICEDKSALEKTLATLLQDPIVGAALYKLTQGSDSVQA